MPGSSGRQAPESGSEEEDADGRSDEARLYAEGVNEAAHDQMLQAAQAARPSASPQPFAMHILLILTSHDQLGDTGNKTGFWMEELAAPYYILRDAGAKVTLASPAGGRPPLDPQSDLTAAQAHLTRRFTDDETAQRALASTTKLANIDVQDFDAVFYAGGHGPLWDLAEDADSQLLIKTCLAEKRPLAVVCHAPAIFKHPKGAGGKSVISGRRVTGFSNTEEASVGFTKVVPFLIEDMLKANGGRYEKGPDGESFVVVDGHLVTGQNPASSAAAAEALLQLLSVPRASAAG